MTFAKSGDSYFLMGRCTIKLAKDKYLEWSTIVDAPITFVQSREEHAAYLLSEYGNHYKEEIEPRLQRADERGHSWQGAPYKNARDAICANRAGPKERNLSLEQIIKIYASADSYEKFFGK